MRHMVGVHVLQLDSPGRSQGVRVAAGSEGVSRRQYRCGIRPEATVAQVGFGFSTGRVCPSDVKHKEAPRVSLVALVHQSSLN